MEPTKQDAEAMLADAGGVQLSVRTRTPQEHVPFFVWGLLMALLGPIRDLGDNSVAGGILQWVVLGGAVAFFLNYLRQSRQVRARPRTPNWLVAALAVWVLATTLLPRMLDGTTNLAYTLAGVLAAAPLLFWADRLRRTA